MSRTYADCVRELFFWQRAGGSATNFTALLFNLMAKADAQNLTRLERAFPDEVAAYQAWSYSRDPNEFFRRHLGQEFGDRAS